MDWLDIIHLVAWGQLGVLIRYYLGLGFSKGNVTSPGLSKPGGALFADLPANILGCLIMGFLSPSDLLLLGRMPTANKQPYIHIQEHHNSSTKSVYRPLLQSGIPWAAMPTGSPLQKNSSLLLGLRTGLCGCLTTYASWVLQSLYMLLGSSPAHPRSHSEWLNGLTSLVLGCLVAQTSLTFGQQLARMMAAYWAYGNKAREDTTAVSQVHVAVVAGQPNVPNTNQSDSSNSQHRVQIEIANTPDRHQQQFSTDSTVKAVQPNVTPELSTQLSLPDYLALAICCTLTGVSIAYVICIEKGVRNAGSSTGDGGGSTGILLWVSILFSPIGCLLRWRLSALNTRPATSIMPWFPFGTWLANNAACLLDFTVASILLRVPSISASGYDVLSAVMTGVGGCLSTVSTWVVELQKLGHGMGANNHAAAYLLGSLIPSVLLGVIIYGPVSWTL